MVTYNQERYIADAIQSVINQQTDFPFRLIIGEDSSTDGTREICLHYAIKYPETIHLVLHDFNQGLVKNYKSLFDVSTAQYVAFLEGDDYWCNNNKLQMQVEILENDPSIGLVHGKFDYLTEGISSNYTPPKYAKLEGNVYNDLLKGNFIGPLTVCFRKSLLDKFVDFNYIINNNFKTIDYFLWLELAYHSNFAFIDEVFATYRKEKGSLSMAIDFKGKVEFMDTILKTLEYFKNKYKNTEHDALLIGYSSSYYKLFLHAIHFNEYERACYYGSLFKPVTGVQHVQKFTTKSKMLLKLGKSIGLFG